MVWRSYTSHEDPLIHRQMADFRLTARCNVSYRVNVGEIEGSSALLV